jgi:hypothetical protein
LMRFFKHKTSGSGRFVRSAAADPWNHNGSGL